MVRKLILTACQLFRGKITTIKLSPVLVKTWAKKGETPIQRTTGNRGAISAISKEGRLVFNLKRGTFRSEDIINFFQQMLKHYPNRHLVVVMDQARRHVSKETRVFVDGQKRLHVFYLPLRSPEFNPDEKLWNHLKHQELKSHQATNVDELEKLTNKKLKVLQKKPKLIQGIFFRSDIAKNMKLSIY